MSFVTPLQIMPAMGSGPGPPNENGDQVLPSIELIDLTGLPTDDESSDEWEDVSNFIDLTNLPSDDEDDAPVKTARPNHAPDKHEGQLAILRRDICELCNRVARYDRGITKHHLYPQSVVKAAPAGTYTDEQRNTLALLCWPCHSAVHRIMSNDRLAASFHSVELLKSHKDVQDWIRRMQRATTAELDASYRRPRRLGISARNSKRRTRLIQQPSSLIRPLPSQRPDEDTSRFGDGLRRSSRLAELGTGAPGTIARVGAFSTSQVSGVKKTKKMTKKNRKRARLVARRLEEATKMPDINKALDTIWARNGNSFPMYPPGETRKNRLLKTEVKGLCSNHSLQWTEVRDAMRSRPEYREWYEWAYSPEPQAAGQASFGPLLDKDSAQTPDFRIRDYDRQAMDGIQFRSGENNDGGAPDNSARESLDAMEKFGDYIPL